MSVSRNHLVNVSILAPALAMYVWLARSFWFIQDDAYISYRFVANFLNGHGLVYNIGERVEGFTNFGWVIILSLLGFGRELFVPLSQWLGLLGGAGVVILTYAIGRQVLSDCHRLWAGLAAMLVAANQSLAYWSPAGLETAAFALMAMLSVWFYLRRSYLLIWSLFMAVWLRPEGAFLAGLVIIIEAIESRQLPRFTLSCAAAALIASSPFVVFKFAYYGSLLPNPFYAKTGLHAEQLTSGFEYAFRYWGHYGFGGLGLIGGVIWYRRMGDGLRAIWWLVLMYTLYIILVGGDVLKVHRFFIPIMGFVAILSVTVIARLPDRIPRNSRALVATVLGAAMIATTIWLPRGYVLRYNNLERRFVQRMDWLATQMKAADSTDFAVALPTIGVFGYRLIGHNIIDMVGLTDSTIARHSEEPIPGMSTTWKERSHNSKYLLTRAPEYISFSTGIKPSAPAERALCLYRPFLDDYRTVGWYYDGGDPTAKGTLTTVFKRIRRITGELVPTYPVEYVQHYKEGLDHYVAGDMPAAIRSYNRALEVSPEPYYVYLRYQKAFALMLSQQHEPAMALLDSVIAQDSLVFEAHKDRYLYAVLTQDSARATIHESWLKRLVPDYWPRVKLEADRMLQSALDMQRRSRTQNRP